MNRKPERGELHKLLAISGLAVGLWSPGDGQTRYRFFPGNGSTAADYHEGDGLYTALGRGEAVTFLRGYLAGHSAAVRRSSGLHNALQLLVMLRRQELLTSDPQALKQALVALEEDTTEVERYCAGGDRCFA